MAWRGRSIAVAMCLSAWSAAAHDLVTSESAERYLARADGDLAVIKSREPAAMRAAAHCDLGRMLDEVRDLLNRDISTHGRVQGLPSNFLVAELKARGAPLAGTGQGGRFAANVSHYRDCLRLSPDGLDAADAMFRLLQC